VLTRRQRTDRGRRRKFSAALQEVIERFALQKSPRPIRVVCNRTQLAAERLGEELPSYDLVHNVIKPPAAASGVGTARHLGKSSETSQNFVTFCEISVRSPSAAKESAGSSKYRSATPITGTHFSATTIGFPKSFRPLNQRSDSLPQVL